MKIEPVGYLVSALSFAALVADGLLRRRSSSHRRLRSRSRRNPL